MSVYCLGLKGKRRLKKVLFHSKRRMVKDIFTENKKNYNKESNGLFKIESGYLPHAQNTNIYRK